MATEPQLWLRARGLLSQTTTSFASGSSTDVRHYGHLAAALGITVIASGLGLIAHAFAVLTNFRGSATRFWVTGWFEWWKEPSDRIYRWPGLRSIRSVGAAIEVFLAVALIAFGGLLVAGR